MAQVYTTEIIGGIQEDRKVIYAGYYQSSAIKKAKEFVEEKMYHRAYITTWENGKVIATEKVLDVG